MSARREIPLGMKLAVTAFVAVLVPYYWVTYSPWNFLFFCDLALLITVVALWTEDPLLASIPAVGITVPQCLWVVDLLTAGRLTGMTSYMFDPKLSLFVRGLSTFHGWLPFLLIYMVWRLGYDRRAAILWTVLSWMVLSACYFLAPPPPAPADHPNLAVNINYVFGPGYEGPQEWMAPWQWFGLLMVLFPVLLCLPAHFALIRLFPQPSGRHPRWEVRSGGEESLA